jgi:hypothetical protein
MAREKDVLKYIEAHAPVSYGELAKKLTPKNLGGMSIIPTRLQNKGKIEKINLADGPRYILSDCHV